MEQRKCSEVQYALLDFLYATKYDCRAIYYLTQMAHELFEPVSICRPDEKTVFRFLKDAGGKKFCTVRYFRNLLTDG